MAQAEELHEETGTICGLRRCWTRNLTSRVVLVVAGSAVETSFSPVTARQSGAQTGFGHGYRCDLLFLGLKSSTRFTSCRKYTIRPALDDVACQASATALRSPSAGTAGPGTRPGRPANTLSYPWTSTRRKWWSRLCHAHAISLFRRSR